MSDTHQTTSTPCPICHAVGEYQVLYPARFTPGHMTKSIFSARRAPDKVHYQLVQCKKCGLVRSHPIFSDDVLSSLYAESEFTYQNETGPLVKTYSRYIKKCMPLLPSCNVYLDIGCGNGFMLDEALQLGFSQALGVEPSIHAIQNAVPHPQKKILQGFFASGLFAKSSMDLITGFQVLDHISQPNEFLDACHETLTPRGIILFINHDVASVFAKLFGESWPIFDIEHTHLYSKKTIVQLFSQHNFEVMRVFNVWNTYSLDYIVRFLPLPVVKTMLLNIITTLHLQKTPLTLYAGNLGVIARKKEK